jgi:hypothetical protein
METAQVAEPLWGNKLYQKRARKAFPVLVRQALAGQPIYYSALAYELGMPNPRNLNYVLGSIGQTLQNLSKKWNEDIPPLSCIVVNKNTGLPGEGVGWFIDDKNRFATLPRKQQRSIVNAELQKIYTYTRWFDVLQFLGLEYKPTQDYTHLAKEVQQRRGKGESEHHRKFKEYISQNPHILNLLKRTKPGSLEYPLPSGDVVDVLFTGKTDWVAVEAKSKVSDVADIYRGLYQCVKYEALIEAYQSELGKPPSCRAVLVIENEFPDKLTELKNLLGVEVIDDVLACMRDADCA